MSTVSMNEKNNVFLIPPFIKTCLPAESTLSNRVLTVDGLIGPDRVKLSHACCVASYLYIHLYYFKDFSNLVRYQNHLGSF